jgi:hypothetical protein
MTPHSSPKLAPAPGNVAQVTADVWDASRSGSHAGRGFRYQDGVATEFAVRSWRGDLDTRVIVPEGMEDVSIERGTGWLHLQAKSRRQHRGQFTLPELTNAWRHLAERLVADPTAKAGLVLERPLPGTESGFDRTLADNASVDVRAAVADAVRDLIQPDDFLARTHVVVMPSPVDTAVALLAEKFGRSPAACVAHEAILRTALGRLADENGVREAADPAAMSAADVARLLDQVTESTDPSLLDEAVQTGIAELVDFMTPVKDEAFFRGIDVVAGHVVAGLPLPRPEIDHLVNGLAAHRLAIAVGPSGAGKSALMWQTAFARRHAVRWYRVLRLNDSDVSALVRLVKGQAGVAVGLVVDDLGRDDRAGFDRLVEQLRDYANAQIVAACREEDLFLVRTANTSVQVRPVLGPELAEQIWRELHEAGETTWPAWREPYEASDGLLLEYGHLLTQGNRLIETVTAQVDQRVREHRDLELDVLTLISTADAFGAEISVRQLVTALPADAAAVRAALTRLIDEHLVHEHDGFLGGLHEVRSLHLMRATHRVPPPILTDTIRQVIHLISGPALQPFLTRLLLDEPVSDDVAIDAVAARLNRSPDLVALASALHALRVVGFHRTAEQWRAIAEQEEAAPTDIATIGLVALSGGDESILPDPASRTVARTRRLDSMDLRAALLPKIRDAVSQALAAASDLPSAVTVLAALGEIGEAAEVNTDALARLAAAASLAEVRTLLEAAYAASSALAATIADGLGGSVVLLERLQQEQPWVRNPRLGVTEDGRPTAEAEYAFVAESAQPNAHEAVVDLARWLAALVPTAQVTACRAVDATGKTAGFMDIPIADKAIDRRNLPNPAAVAWNRARVRAAISVVAALTTTDHAVAAREIVVLSKQVAQETAETFARGGQPTKKLIASAMALVEATNRLRPAPLAVEAAGPLDEGELPMDDPVTSVARMIASNLLLRLFRGERVGPMISQIINQVDKIGGLDAWRFLEDVPTAEITVLRRVLVDLHAVVSERATNGAGAAVVVAGKKGLSSGAAAARRHAEVRARVVLDRVERSLVAAGFGASVLRREGEPTAHAWPSEELLILVNVASVVDWLLRVQQIADLCRQQLPDHISFLMAPVRGGRVVASYGVKVISNVLPDDSVKTWPDLDLLDEALGDTVRRGVSGLIEASGIVASVRGDEIHDTEMAAVDAAALRARETCEHLATQHEDDQLLREVFGGFTELAQKVEDEASAVRDSRRVKHSVAASIIAGMRGEENELFATMLGLFAACAEWDVDPIDAWTRFELQADDSSQ